MQTTTKFTSIFEFWSAQYTRNIIPHVISVMYHSCANSPTLHLTLRCTSLLHRHKPEVDPRCARLHYIAVCNGLRWVWQPTGVGAASGHMELHPFPPWGHQARCFLAFSPINKHPKQAFKPAMLIPMTVKSAVHIHQDLPVAANAAVLLPQRCACNLCKSPLLP